MCTRARLLVALLACTLTAALGRGSCITLGEVETILNVAAGVALVASPTSIANMAAKESSVVSTVSMREAVTQTECTQLGYWNDPIVLPHPATVYYTCLAMHCSGGEELELQAGSHSCKPVVGGAETCAMGCFAYINTVSQRCRRYSHESGSVLLNASTAVPCDTNLPAQPFALYAATAMVPGYRSELRFISAEAAKGVEVSVAASAVEAALSRAVSSASCWEELVYACVVAANRRGADDCVVTAEWSASNASLEYVLNAVRAWGGVEKLADSVRHNSTLRVACSDEDGCLLPYPANSTAHGAGPKIVLRLVALNMTAVHPSLAIAPAQSAALYSVTMGFSPTATATPSNTESRSASWHTLQSQSLLSQNTSLSSCSSSRVDSATASFDGASPSHSLPLPPPSPIPNRSPVSHVLSEDAAVAVVASGSASAALTSFVATTSAGHAMRMGALLRSIECTFASELSSPSIVELPLQSSIGSCSEAVSSQAGSALLTSAVLVVLPLLVCAAAHAVLSSCGACERPTLRWLQSSVVSRYCSMSMAFFAPNVVMSTVVVVGHCASAGAVVAAVCAAVVPLLVGCVAAQRALAMDVEVVPLYNGKWGLRNRPSSRAFAETFGALVDGCRDPMRRVVRVCFLEDAAASLVLSLLSGVSLSTARCEWVALAMLFVSALHLLYVVWVRPLRSKIESALNCTLCAVQVLMAALCLAIVSGADNRDGIVMSVLGTLAVIQNVSFFAQAAILAACAFVRESQKKHAAVAEACGPPSDMRMVIGRDELLLTVPDAKQLPLIFAS